MNYFESSSDHAQKPAFPPVTSAFLALNGNEVVSVSTASVNLDLQIGKIFLPIYLPLPGCVAVPKNGL